MAQVTDYTLSAAQNGVNYTIDINEYIQTLLTCASGTAAPTQTFAYMLWADTTNGVMKIRNSGNTAWVTLFPLGTDLETWDASKFNAYGLGVSTTTGNTAIDSVASNGFYRLGSLTSGANHTLPSDIHASNLAWVVHLQGSASNEATQRLWQKNAAGTVTEWVRIKAAGTWGSWVGVVAHAPQLGKYQFNGTAPVYATTTTLTMAAMECWDSTFAQVIAPSGGTLNLGTTGAMALDTGAIASATWYWIYAIYNPTTNASSYVASASATSPTLPSGYTLYRRLPFPFTTKSGGATIEPFAIKKWDGARQETIYTDAPSNRVLLASGTATSFTTVTATALVPSGSRELKAAIQNSSTTPSTSTDIYTRETGSGLTTGTYLGTKVISTVAADTSWHGYIGVSSGRQFDYRCSATSSALAVTALGFTFSAMEAGV